MITDKSIASLITHWMMTDLVSNPNQWMTKSDANYLTKIATMYVLLITSMIMTSIK